MTLKNFRYSFIILGLSLLAKPVAAQQSIRYTGTTLVNVDYHHGQLAPVLGVHSTQVLRANREHPEMAEGTGWTYNHAPMLSYWNKSFYLEYLSDSIGESVPPGQTLLMWSKDGQNWTRPQIIFPCYRIPDGTTKEGKTGVAKDLDAVMHQRMGFYVSKKNRLLVLGFYGICLDPKDDPNDGKGIGRVVREVLGDGKFGPIYFIHYNPKWNDKNTSYPFYKKSKDKGFIAACDELMATPLMMQQWNEEADRNDTLIPVRKDFKAFCYYHLPDGKVVGLWKNALTAISTDEGKSWLSNPSRAPKFVNSNAKIWGQRTSDNRYATVYNPSEYRWPLAISTSENGLDYTNLLLVNGEISPMRYGGAYKSFGPQYVRGIIEGNGKPDDGNLWVTYSMNKEDIWITKIPVPVKDKADAPVNEIFNQMTEGHELDFWNYNSCVWAPVQIEKMADGTRSLALRDKDRYDYARAERLFPESKKAAVSFSVTPAQENFGKLDIELQDAKGNASIRLSFDPDSSFKGKNGARYSNFMKYKAGQQYDIKISFDTDARMYKLNVNGKDLPMRIMFAPSNGLSRIVFRTGEVRRYPTADTPADQDFDLQNPGTPEKEAAFFIKSLKTE